MTTPNGDQEVQQDTAEDTGQDLENMSDAELEALAQQIEETPQPIEKPLTRRELEEMLGGVKAEIQNVTKSVYSYVDRRVSRQQQPTPTYQAPVYVPPIAGQDVDPAVQHLSQQVAALAQERAQERAIQRQREAFQTAVESQKQDIERLANRLGVPQDKIDWATDTYDLAERWERATESIANAVRNVKEETTVAKPKLTPEQIAERRRQLASAETTPTGGTSRRFEQIEQDYADGKITYEKYAEARKARGI